MLKVLPASFVPRVQIRSVSRQSFYPHLATGAGHKFLDLGATVDGRSIPDHQQPFPRAAQQVQKELNAVQPIQPDLPYQGVDLGLRCHSTHDRQVIARLLLPQHRRQPLGSIRPHDSRQQVEARFVLENQHAALAPCSLLQFRPDLLPPALNHFLVPLNSPPDRHLGRPVQLLEQPADVIFVVADPELLLDDPGHPRAGPDLTPKSVRFRAMPEEFGDQTLLRSREFGRWPRMRASVQGLWPAVTNPREPPADTHRGDAERLCNIRPRPTLPLQVQRSKPPPFQPISRKDMNGLHTPILCGDESNLYCAAVSRLAGTEARIMVVGSSARRGRRPRKTPFFPLVAYGPFIAPVLRWSRAMEIPSGPQLLGEKVLYFRAVLPQQPLQVQHTRPGLALVPGRVEPPRVAFRRFQPELQQPQQRHRQQQRLGRAQNRLLGPGSALFPAQPLLEVAEAVLLTEAGAEQLQQLQSRQVAGTTDQREALAVALDLGHHRLDFDLVAQHPPQAHDL